MFRIKFAVFMNAIYRVSHGTLLKVLHKAVTEKNRSYENKKARPSIEALSF